MTLYAFTCWWPTGLAKPELGFHKLSTPCSSETLTRLRTDLHTAYHVGFVPVCWLAGLSAAGCSGLYS